MKPTRKESANTTTMMVPATRAVRRFLLARRRSTRPFYHKLARDPPVKPAGSHRRGTPRGPGAAGLGRDAPGLADWPRSTPAARTPRPHRGPPRLAGTP